MKYLIQVFITVSLFFISVSSMAYPGNTKPKNNCLILGISKSTVLTSCLPNNTFYAYICNCKHHSDIMFDKWLGYLVCRSTTGENKPCTRLGAFNPKQVHPQYPKNLFYPNQTLQPNVRY